MTNTKLPPVKKLAEAEVETITQEDVKHEVVQVQPKRKNYVVLQTATIRGTRLNLDSMESYSPSGDLGLTIAKASGAIKLEFNSRQERDDMLAKLDSYCL